MNRFFFLVLSLAVVLVTADDDGQYRPGQYGDDGRYRGGDEGRYDGINGIYTPDRRIYAIVPASSNIQPSRGIFQTRGPIAVRPSPIVDYAPPQSRFVPQPVGIRVSGSSNPESKSQILKYVADVLPDGYNWGYETENGIKASEQADLVNAGTKDESIRASGFYEYIGNDNVLYRVDYIADENGFQPRGAHLPKA